MKVLQKLTIKVRMNLILSFVFIGLMILSSIMLYKEKEILYDQQKEKVQKIVEGAQSIIQFYHQKAQNGELTDQEARDAAKTLLSEYRYDKNNYVWINDSAPTMIMHPFKPELNGKSIAGVKDPDGVALFIEMVNVVKKDKKGFVAYKWPKPGADEPVKKISFVSYFQPWQWIIGTGVYIDNVENIHAQNRNIILFVSLIILVVLFFSISTISNSIITPARRAYNLMNDISEGEGDLTKHLSVSGQDAIARLSRAFNLFVDKMRSSLQDVAKSAEQTGENAKMLEETSQHNQQFIQNQSDVATQVAAAMEQMTANIKEVSSNAESAEHAAIDAQKNTVEGKAIVSNTITQIESLSKDIDDVTLKIEDLANESVNIGSVLDVIRSIAEQTNLLALNAAIEAARAGEQGRGFAVVADEVRTLASRTGQSTDEIQQMIERLQSGATQAVTAVTNSQSLVKQTVESAAKADGALTTIDELMSLISQMNSQIARATEQQTDAAGEVNLRVAELADMAAEALSITENLAKSSNELMASSVEMNNVVSRFKLE